MFQSTYAALLLLLVLNIIFDWFLFLAHKSPCSFYEALLYLMINNLGCIIWDHSFIFFIRIIRYYNMLVIENYSKYVSNLKCTSYSHLHGQVTLASLCIVFCYVVVVNNHHQKVWQLQQYYPVQKMQLSHGDYHWYCWLTFVTNAM